LTLHIAMRDNSIRSINRHCQLSKK